MANLRSRMWGQGSGVGANRQLRMLSMPNGNLMCSNP